MKKFHFKLESYLKVKEIEYKRKIFDLSKVIGELHEKKNQIEKYYSEQGRLSKDRTLDLENSELDLVFIKNTQNYFSFLGKKKQIVVRQIEEIEKKFIEKKEIANEARKVQRVVELLKEKKWREHKILLKKEEEKDIDDFNIKKFKKI